MQTSWAAALVVVLVATVGIFSIVEFDASTSPATVTGLPTVDIEQANLVSTSPTTSPSSPLVDSPVLIRFLVLNRGKASAYPDVDIEDGGATTREEVPVNSRIPACTDVEVLEPNRGCWVQQRLTYSTSGAKRITVTLDIDNSQIESNEGDNVRIKTFVVRTRSGSSSDGSAAGSTDSTSGSGTTRDTTNSGSGTTGGNTGSTDGQSATDSTTTGTTTASTTTSSCGGAGQAPCSSGTICGNTLTRTATTGGLCCAPNQKANTAGTACEACQSNLVRAAGTNTCSSSCTPQWTPLQADRCGSFTQTNSCTGQTRSATGTSSCPANFYCHSSNICQPVPEGYNCANGICNPAQGPSAGAQERSDAALGTGSLSKYAKTVGTGTYGDAPLANGQCAAGLIVTTDRDVRVCRVADRTPKLPQLIPQYRAYGSAATVAADGSRAPAFTYLNAAWSVLGDFGGWGGDCTMVTGKDFGTAVATGLVPNTYEGYESYSSWLCQTSLLDDQWYSLGRARWVYQGATTSTPDADMLRFRVSNNGNLVTGIKLERVGASSTAISPIAVYADQAPYAAIGQRTQITVSGGTGDVSADIQFSAPQSGQIRGVSELTSCRYVEVPLSSSSPIVLTGAPATKVGTNLYRITISEQQFATPIGTKAYRIFCTDAKTAERQADPFAWRLVGEVELRVVTPIVRTISCSLGSTAGYATWTAPAGGPRFASHAAVKPVHAIISGNGIALENPAEVTTVVRRDDAGMLNNFAGNANSGAYTANGVTTVVVAGLPEACSGTSCLRNPWGNVDRVYLPGFELNKNGKCPGQWCDGSIPPRSASERPFILVPISQAEYNAGLAFINSLDGPAGFAVNFWAGADPRIHRIREVNYQNMGGFSQVNTRYGTPWTGWSEYRITCQ